MNLLVVGAGAMGRWVARTVDADVTFTDVDPEAARDAAAAVGGEAVGLSATDTFDVVCLAVPLDAVAEAAAVHAPRADAAVFDVTGAMEPAVDALREHAPDCERLSLHPLFAPEHAPGRVAVVADVSGPVTTDVLSDVEANGNTLVETTPAEHDDAMRTVQARAHAAILAFGLAADDVPDGLHTPVSEALTDLVDRVSDGEPRVYADVQAAFGGAHDVADAAARIADADPEAFEALYREVADR